MPRPLQACLILCCLVLPGRPVASQPLPGSQLPLEENMCAQCHGEPDLWQGDQARLYIPADHLAGDVHWKQGVVCHDCHGGDPSSRQFLNLHRPENGFRATAAEIRQACANCHRTPFMETARKSVHAKAGERDASGVATSLECSSCHGPVQHQLVSASDPQSPVYRDNQATTCGACHPKDLDSHESSVHAPNPAYTGSVPQAMCADCHGSHGIYRVADLRSTLHLTNVSSTCGRCHPDIEATLQQSVHRTDWNELEGSASLLTSTKKQKQGGCTSCHMRHEPASLASTDIATHVASIQRCSSCHADISGKKTQRTHAVLSDTGMVPAATCAECHGAHDIRLIRDADSRLAGANRLQTCRTCHPGAVKNFADYNPHANPKNGEKYASLHSDYERMETVIFALLVFFFVHTCLWLVRSLVHVLQHGRHRRLKTSRQAIIRFSRVDRLFHATAILSLLGLSATGLAMKYDEQPWTNAVAHALGGFRAIGAIHLLFGLVAVGCCLTYTILAARAVLRIAKSRKPDTPWSKIVFGPDSPAPNKRDLGDLMGMLAWFFGLGKKPVFERWTYWEKFTYWGIAAVMAVIGTSGLMVWQPNFFARFVSGATLNWAHMTHSYVSLAATGSLLAIYYFNVHFRPEKFPMDVSFTTGLVREDHLQDARPEYIERLRQEGKLDRLRVMPNSNRYLWAVTIISYLTHFVGLALVAAIIYASLGS